MPSRTYQLIRAAIIGRKQVACRYHGLDRELCPHILGLSGKGEEVALVFQFAGRSSRRLPPGGGWKCLRLSDVNDPRLRDGPWHTGAGHARFQSCVHTVDYDVNPSSPYSPRR